MVQESFVNKGRGFIDVVPLKATEALWDRGRFHRSEESTRIIMMICRVRTYAGIRELWKGPHMSTFYVIPQFGILPRVHLHLQYLSSQINGK